MLVDVFELLFAQRQARSAYRGYIEAIRDYWVARAELTRASGGSLPETTSPATAKPAPVESEPMQDMPDKQPMEHDHSMEHDHPSRNMSHEMQH
jgi:cobalt-zinc-cadmium efflux system outer membrane protein